MLCVLLESNDLMLLIYTRWTYKAIARRLRKQLRYSSLDVHVEQIGIHAIGKHNRSKQHDRL